MNLIMLFFSTACHSWFLVFYMCFMIQSCEHIIFLGIILGEACAEGSFLKEGFVFASARGLEAPLTRDRYKLNYQLAVFKSTLGL